MPARSDLAISLHLPGQVQATTIDGSAYQTSYVSLPGNFTGDAVLPTQRTIFSWPFESEVDVRSPAAAIVALGTRSPMAPSRRATPITAGRIFWRIAC